MPEYLVLTADQIDSRHHADAVPEALATLHRDVEPFRGFARTAGDEIQALFCDSTQALRALEILVSRSGWRIGVGIGAVQSPVPQDVRASSGEAFILARDAVSHARRSPQHVWVCGSERVNAALLILTTLWNRRSPAGWQVATMLDQGLSVKAIAEKLHITPSAVSQRARAAQVDEVSLGKQLLQGLIDDALH